MNNLLLFFAFPIATIIFAIVFQKVLRNIYLTTASIFAIYLVVTFTAFDINFIVYAIVYTIIALLTAVLTEFILNRFDEDDNEGKQCNYNNRELLEKDNINMINNNRFYRCYRR